MSELRTLQEKFTVAIGRLIAEANIKGISLSFGDAYRDPRVFGPVGESMGYGTARSCHKSRLAVDFNVLNPESHKILHDIWDSLGGSERLASDMNHYSFSYNGMR